MESKIIQEFKGKINGVLIKDDNNYHSTRWLLEQIEEKFGEVYNQDFVKDLSKTIETMYFKYDSFSYAEVENEFNNSIKEATKINEIDFSYYGNHWKIENFNEKIKNNLYLSEKAKKILKENPDITREDLRELSKITEKNKEEELKKLVKEVSNSEVSRGNYNALTGNEVLTTDHTSGNKRWITVDDVRKYQIGVKENEKPTLTIITHKEEEKMYVKPIEYYNTSQLEITREIERQFKPLKEKAVDKSKEKGQGIGD